MRSTENSLDVTKIGNGWVIGVNTTIDIIFYIQGQSDDNFNKYKEYTKKHLLRALLEKQVELMEFNTTYKIRLNKIEYVNTKWGSESVYFDSNLPEGYYISYSLDIEAA